MERIENKANKPLFAAFLRHIPAIALLFVVYSTYTRSSIADGLLNDADLLVQLILGTALFYGNLYGYFPLVGRRWGWQNRVMWLAVLVEWVAVVALIVLLSVLVGGLELHARSLRGLTFHVANSTAALFPLFLCVLYSVQHYNMYRLEHDKQKGLRQLADMGQHLDTLKKQWLHANLPEHFLLNGMTLLRQLVMDRSPHAGKAFDWMVDILHYGLDTRHSETVPVKKELKMVRKYIDIYRMRKRSTFGVKLTKKGPLEQVRILPMAVLGLVENIFAHGDLQSHPAELHVEYRYPYLYITTTNMYSARATKRHTGFGLSNLRMRLENVYPDAFILENGLDDDRYVVSLLVSTDRQRNVNPPKPDFGTSKTFG